METPARYTFDNKNLVNGFRTQTEWRWLITTAFFLGGLGGGLFMVSLFTQFTIGALVGWCLAVVAKGIVHLLYLGNPWRFWRAVTNVRSSWLARGITAIFGLAAFGFVYGLMALEWIPGKDSALYWVLAVLAGACTLVVMVYDGFMLAAPPSIPLYHNALLPVLAGAYSLLGGTTIALALSEWGAPVPDGFPAAGLHELELIMVLVNFALLMVFLTIGWSQSVTSKESVKLLFREYGLLVIGGIIIIGLAVVGITAAFAELSTGVLIGIAIAELIGDYLVWWTILRVGVYAPINPRAVFAR